MITKLEHGDFVLCDGNIYIVNQTTECILLFNLYSQLINQAKYTNMEELMDYFNKKDKRSKTLPYIYINDVLCNIYRELEPNTNISNMVTNNKVFELKVYKK